MERASEILEETSFEDPANLISMQAWVGASAWMRFERTRSYNSEASFSTSPIIRSSTIPAPIAVPQLPYCPAGVLQRWRNATGNEKSNLDTQYGIEKKLDEMAFHERESIFVKFLTKELAGYLKCAPKLETVIAARNERVRGRYGH